MADIEKYIEYGNYLYITGYYTPSGLLNGKIPSLMPNSEKLTWFDNIEEVPHYTILNYETGDIRLYKTLQEVPEKDRKIFEKDLSFWCEFKRTCFEK